MGLFSVLKDSSNTSNAESGEAAEGAGILDGATTVTSASIPTVLQLYAGDKEQQLIQLETTSVLSGYSALTYQAIQIGSEEEDDDVKNKHQTPDLGVWNCHAKPGLVDSLLATLPHIRVFVFTVDLSQPHQVEPTLTTLQSALSRHLIEHPPPSTAVSGATTTTTTSLYDLQATDFGRAKEDVKQEEKAINEEFRDIRTTLMICAKLPHDLPPEMSEDEAYKTKQAQALVIYHLRKYASNLNCTLSFVQPNKDEKKNINNTSNNANPAALDKDLAENGAGGVAANNTTSLQPTATYSKLSQWWRDLALGKPIWEEMKENHEHATGGTSQGGGDIVAVTPETVQVATPLYGPGQHQEDLIESVVLRSATYPGHWDASKDSLWKALPTSREETNGDNQMDSDGDKGWLGQLRDSIAAAAPEAISPEKKAATLEEPKKDAEVSDFFASLLKKP